MHGRADRASNSKEHRRKCQLCPACRCAEAFVSAGHHAKAVSLLVRAGEPARALELLLQHEVPLSEELAEALTPEKTPDNADTRSSVLMRIAQVCLAVPLQAAAWKVNRANKTTFQQRCTLLVKTCAHWHKQLQLLYKP